MSDTPYFDALVRSDFERGSSGSEARGSWSRFGSLGERGRISTPSPRSRKALEAPSVVGALYDAKVERGPGGRARWTRRRPGKGGWRPGQTGCRPGKSGCSRGRQAVVGGSRAAVGEGPGCVGEGRVAAGSVRRSLIKGTLSSGCVRMRAGAPRLSGRTSSCRPGRAGCDRRNAGRRTGREDDGRGERACCRVFEAVERGRAAVELEGRAREARYASRRHDGAARFQAHQDHLHPRTGE